MKLLSKALTLSVLTFAFSTSMGCKSSAATFASTPSATGEVDAADLVGVWQGGMSDPGATEVITLDLRADGTYTKTLKTNLGVGGSHSGTWKSNGMVVYLSGDGNWPPYSHNLSSFRKIR